ncbi:hypothetical protein LL912_19350 [Niabella sp. CC-SYL272]|uniref:hypothetical protein n=1 Tax=Niabella agricola TaxID=2891571 RepID=UPI001F29A78F|nr:hypothetical protein [Niabella agricola]MCF3110951.1 hypothetical protein [Niabella agricola]
MDNIKEFEAGLLKKLDVKDIDKNAVRNISKEIVNLKKNGLLIDQVFVKGIPRLDRYIINGIVDPEFWSKFNNVGGIFSRFEVFPYGVIAHQSFKFTAEIER